MANIPSTAVDRLAALILAVFVFATNTSTHAQDRMVLGPRQFERDTSGSGAVLCTWSIYLSVQAETAACGYARRPADDAIDQAISAIDEFILANSSLRPTRPMLEEFKKRAGDSHVRALRNRCDGKNIEPFRKASPEELQAAVKSLLAVPREPVMNPCL